MTITEINLQLDFIKTEKIKWSLKLEELVKKANED